MLARLLAPVDTVDLLASSTDGFLGCDESFNYTLPPELRTADYGEPLAPCKELSDGVFDSTLPVTSFDEVKAWAVAQE